MFQYYAWIDDEGMESHPKRITILKDVNDDDDLVISSSGVVFEVNERGKLFYRALRDIVRRTYRHNFHLKYKNQSIDSKNQVIRTLQEVFPEPWPDTYETCNTKKESYKMYYY